MFRRHHLQWFNDVPLREGKDAHIVNWSSLTITDAKGKITYQGALVISLSVDKTNVAEIADYTSARWKVENETFNVSKNNGHHLEHKLGYGKQNLATMFAAMNLLAFVFHPVSDTIDSLWIRAGRPDRCEDDSSSTVAQSPLISSSHPGIFS